MGRIRQLGPRGLSGLFGWSFFDPANLVIVPCLLASAALVIVSMQGRGAPDWGMAIGLYLCLLVFSRGYFFHYCNGGLPGRLVIGLVLTSALIASSLLWRDRAPAFEVLRESGQVVVPAAAGFEWAALLHWVAAITLVIHTCLPRRWLVRTTEELQRVPKRFSHPPESQPPPVLEGD